MPFVSVTRLRVRALRYLPGTLLESVRTRRQVRAAPGFRGGALLIDRERAFWTATAWDSEATMRAYMTSGAHRAAMPKLLDWCDEASVVHWTQEDDAVPTWSDADRRMREGGRASKVRNPNARHADLSYRTARPFISDVIKPATPA